MNADCCVDAARVPSWPTSPGPANESCRHGHRGQRSCQACDRRGRSCTYPAARRGRPASAAEAPRAPQMASCIRRRRRDADHLPGGFSACPGAGGRQCRPVRRLAGAHRGAQPAGRHSAGRAPEACGSGARHPIDGVGWLRRDAAGKAGLDQQQSESRSRYGRGAGGVTRGSAATADGLSRGTPTLRPRGGIHRATWRAPCTARPARSTCCGPAPWTACAKCWGPPARYLGGSP